MSGKALLSASLWCALKGYNNFEKKKEGRGEGCVNYNDTKADVDALFNIGAFNNLRLSGRETRPSTWDFCF